MTDNTPAPASAETHQIVASSTAGLGRYVIEGEKVAFLSDSASRGETIAPGPVDLLLTALGVCALGSVQRRAGELEIELPDPVSAEVTSTRNEEYPTWFELVLIRVRVPGVAQDVAEELVSHFTSNCPIFNTVRRGGPIAVEVVSGTGDRRVLESLRDPASEELAAAR